MKKNDVPNIREILSICCERAIPDNYYDRNTIKEYPPLSGKWVGFPCEWIDEINKNLRNNWIDGAEYAIELITQNFTLTPKQCIKT